MKFFDINKFQCVSRSGGGILSRLLKYAHLLRFHNPSPCQARGRLVAAYIQVRLIPQDLGGLASWHF